MSKKVRKHCSIINYLRQNHEDIYELVQDLCLTKMFVPQRDQGVTFLLPGKEALAEIKKLAYSDTPENAVVELNKLVLRTYVSTLSDFTNADLVTYNWLSLKVDDKSNAKNNANVVMLPGGAKVTANKDFETRKDRSGNMAIYNIDKLYDSTGLQPREKKLPPMKKGGADLNDNGTGAPLSRFALFEKILKDHCTHCNNRDVAMEMLVSMYDWAVKNNQELAKLIKSQCSYDTLASLAVILQPYKADPTYIQTDVLNKMISGIMGDGDFRTSIHYTLIENCAEKYKNLAGSTEYNQLIKEINETKNEQASEMAKPTAVNVLKDAYNKLVTFTNSDKVPTLRKTDNKTLLLAESELRVLSALLQENSSLGLESDDLIALFQKCNLNHVYMCNDSQFVNSASIGFYYSTVNLILRSDAFFYLPGYDGSTTAEIADETKYISLNKTFESDNRVLRKKSQDLVNAYRDNLKQRLVDAQPAPAVEAAQVPQVPQ